MTLLERYQDELRNFPIPGGGGAHPHELKVANLGFLSGLRADQIFQDIRNAVPTGSRKVSDTEISDAVNKALTDHQGGTFTPRPRPKPVVQDGATARQRIIDSAKIWDEADLWEASPIRIDWPPVEDVQHAL